MKRDIEIARYWYNSSLGTGKQQALMLFATLYSRGLALQVVYFLLLIM